MKKLLLHTCCGPCASGSIGRLTKEYEVTLFWSNSNIYPKEEYYLRLKAAKQLAKKKGLELIEDEYDHTLWREAIAGFEDEPEKGKRCPLCFKFSLERTAKFCLQQAFDCFTTTLTISPHKNSKQIFKIGYKAALEFGVEFIEEDFKKQNGFSCSLVESKKHELYRQNYCGCECSRRSIESPKE